MQGSYIDPQRLRIYPYTHEPRLPKPPTAVNLHSQFVHRLDTGNFGPVQSQIANGHHPL